MQNNTVEQEITVPAAEDFNDNPAFQGSIQQFLSENIGNFVVIDFLIGTQAMTTRQGILYSVGASYVVLFEERSKTFILCDIFAIKFVTFYYPGQRPGNESNQNS